MAIDEKAIFVAALALPDAKEREAYLQEACAGNPELLGRLRELLSAHEESQGPLDRGPVAFGATLGAADIERPGATIGPYKLIEQIGEGGMGTVWMAQQTEPVKRLVAIKLIKPGMDSKQVIARFEAERQALALMDHPNIARVLDGGTTKSEPGGVSPGRPYFVMDLVKGVPITKYCDDHHLTPRQRLELFIPVCQAIQHSHQKGIIHRDLKPSNVVVALYDGKPVPKVIDFGVAKAAGQTLTDKTLVTGFGSIIGTLEYMSPEQAEINQLDIDTRTDIYSLGVLLYELLTGSPPFTKKELEKAGMLELLRVIREKEATKPSTKLSTAESLPTLAANRGTEPAKLSKLLRGELDWIVMKCLEKDRNRRYETANGLAMDVQRYLADEPVQACPPSAGYRLRKFARRNKGPLLAASLVLLALVGGIVGTSWQALQATSERNAKKAALEQSRLMSADLAFDKGQLLGERGDADLALLWMARSLKLVPREATELESAIRLSLCAWKREVNSVRMVLPHDGAIVAVAFSPNGKFVTASWNWKAKTLKVQRWDATTGRPGDPIPFSVTGGPSDGPATAFSPNADYLLLGFDNGIDGTFQLMDLASGKEVWHDRQKGGHVTRAVFSPDAKKVLIGFSIDTPGSLPDAGKVQLFEVATGERVGRSLEFNRPVCAAAFDPEGKTFVTECGLYGNATEKTEARFWDLDGHETGDRLLHDCVALAVTFSPDRTKLLTGHWDFKARLWNLESPKDPKVLSLDAPVISVAFSPDGKTLLTGSFDGTVRFWDLTGRLLSPPLRHDGLVQAAAFDATGRTALVGIRAANASRLWELAPSFHNGLSDTKADDDRILFPLAFSSDRRTILTRDGQNTAQLRDAATGQPIGKPLPHQRPVIAGAGMSLVGYQRHACSSDRRRVLTVDEDNVARLWDTMSGKLLTVLKPELNQTVQPIFFAAAFSPDSKFLVTGNFLWKVHLWDAATGELLPCKLEHEPHGGVRGVAFSPDGRILATGGADRAVRFWDSATGERLDPPLQNSKAIFALSFSSDGKTVVTGGTDSIVELWDVASRSRRLRLLGHQAAVNVAAFSPNGRWVVTGSRDNTARLWDVVTGKQIGPPLPHPGPVVRVAFSLDGATILTATEDEMARDWRVPTAITGSPEEIELWTQVVTGLELEADGGVLILDTDTWQNRRQMLINAGSHGLKATEMKIKD
jgi:WD40 repeat protein/serine/threonine protein kinase